MNFQGFFRVSSLIAWAFIGQAQAQTQVEDPAKKSSAEISKPASPNTPPVNTQTGTAAQQSALALTAKPTSSSPPAAPAPGQAVTAQAPAPTNPVVPPANTGPQIDESKLPQLGGMIEPGKGRSENFYFESPLTNDEDFQYMVEMIQYQKAEFDQRVAERLRLEAETQERMQRVLAREKAIAESMK